jgi:hypothetical protein
MRHLECALFIPLLQCNINTVEAKPHQLQNKPKRSKMIKKILDYISLKIRQYDEKTFNECHFKYAQDIVDVERILRQLDHNRKGFSR